MSQPRFLLILACSQRKRPDPGPLSALQRYDGVNYRVLHKAQRSGLLPRNLDLLILSAKHGLITPDTSIDNYDLRMTKPQALSLQRQVSFALDHHLSSHQYDEIFINLGRTYLLALSTSAVLPTLSHKLRMANGGIGQKMSQMKQWLYNISSHPTS